MRHARTGLCDLPQITSRRDAVVLGGVVVLAEPGVVVNRPWQPAANRVERDILIARAYMSLKGSVRLREILALVTSRFPQGLAAWVQRRTLLVS